MSGSIEPRSGLRARSGCIEMLLEISAHLPMPISSGEIFLKAFVFDWCSIE
jgi:hypothetical protein